MEQKNKNIAYATIAIVATASVFIYLRTRNKKAKAAIAQKKAKEEKVLSGVEPTSELPKGVIGFGSKGEDVKDVQRYMNVTCPSELKQLGLYPLEICGTWGEKTEKASISCSSLKRNTIDSETLKRIKRDLGNSKS